MTTSTNNLANPCEPEDFAFRNKFEKLLTDENRCPITSAFQKFCGFDEKEAILHLWHLTTCLLYTSDAADDSWVV